MVRTPFQSRSIAGLRAWTHDPLLSGREGSTVVNSSQGGSKDTWVVEREALPREADER